MWSYHQKNNSGENSPEIFFVGYSVGLKNYTPSIECNPSHTLILQNSTYRLSGIVYLKSHHFWCEIFSTQQDYKNGWFLFNGMWNNGKTTFVGHKPLFVEKESLHLLMFEKLKVSMGTPHIFNTSYRPFHSNNTEIVKSIIKHHKEALSLPDNKVKLENLKSILQYHNITIKSSMKLDELKDLLLQNCNNTNNFPISFVSDENIQFCYVAQSMKETEELVSVGESQ